MAHIFQFDDATRLYARETASEAAADALKNGRLFYKIDGSNGMVICHQSEDDSKGKQLMAYQRLDTRGKPIPQKCITLPEGLNAAAYEGHSYCYEPITADVEGKKLRKRNEAMLAVVQAHADQILLHGNAVSIEWVGKKFNKTPGVPHDVAIAIHAEQVCEETIDRTYDGMRSFLLENDPPIEGFVVEWNGVWWKIRADCFDRKCKFKTQVDSVKRPVYLAL